MPNVPPGCPLTRRQYELVQLLAEGLQLKVAATRLGIAHSTARGHIAAAGAALGTGFSGAALVIEAGRRGWLGWTEPEEATPLAVEHPWLGVYLHEFDQWLESGMRDRRARNRMTLALGGHRDKLR